MFPDTGGRPGLRAPFSPSLFKYTLASSLVCRREKLKQTTGSSRVMTAQAGRKSAKRLWVDSQSAPAPPPAHPQASVSRNETALTENSSAVIHARSSHNDGKLVHHALLFRYDSGGCVCKKKKTNIISWQKRLIQRFIVCAEARPVVPACP